MIDARADFAGALNEANTRLASIDNSLRFLLGELTLNLAQIAKRQQVSRTQVSREPWRVPGLHLHLHCMDGDPGGKAP